VPTISKAIAIPSSEKKCAPHSFTPPYRWGERVYPPLFSPPYRWEERVYYTLFPLRYSRNLKMYLTLLFPHLYMPLMHTAWREGIHPEKTTPVN